MLTHKNSVILFYLLLCSSVVHSAIIIRGDQAAPSFTFPIGTYTKAENRGGITFFVGAGDTSGGDHTVSRLNYMANQFMPMSPKTIKLGNETDVANPFRNEEITLLSSISKASAGIGHGDFAPLFITDTDPKTLYMIDTVYSDGTVKAIKNFFPIVDASGTDESDGIVALTGASEGAVFAAILANGESSFGVGNSGITLFGVSDVLTVNNKEEKGPFLVQRSITPLNTASTILTIDGGSALVSIDNVIDFHWDSRINRLFIGLQVVGDSGASDGARGVVVGRFARAVVDEKRIITGVTLQEIAPNDIFTGTNKIVGGTGADIEVSIHNVRTLHTSNTHDNSIQLGLSYLIVQGDVGAPADTKRSVYALPLVCSGDDAHIGTLAKKDSTIVNSATAQTYPVRVKHCFNEPAADSTDLYNTDDNNDIIKVGQDETIGDIEDICVIGDTVFVSVSSITDPNTKPGVFYSQAILDERNAIIRWTPWQQFGNVTESAFGFFTDNFAGQVQYLTGMNSATINTFKRSEWGSGTDTMSEQLLSALGGFSVNQGGIQGFANYPKNAPGLSGTDGDVTAMITTGNGKIIIGQSGNNTSGTFCPTTDTVEGNTITYKNGTVDVAPPTSTKVVTFEGGALDTVGSIITSEITVDATLTTRLFVGGVNGLAVLVKANGDGWDANDGLGNNFEGLAVDMAFKTIGDYSFVQKLFTDGDFLYVLTPQKLDRIDLKNSDFVACTLFVATVADITTMPAGSAGTNSAFCDMLASGKCALLATTFGLFRVGNGANITNAINAAAINWTPVPTLFGVGPVVALQAITTSGLPQDFANGSPGNVDALTADTGNNRARISRFAIQDVSGGNTIDDNTVQPLNDVYQNDVKQYFLNPGNLVQRFSTDGALTLLGMNRTLNLNPLVYSLKSHLPINLAQASNIISITKNSASGSRLVVANTGLFTDE